MFKVTYTNTIHMNQEQEEQQKKTTMLQDKCTILTLLQEKSEFINSKIYITTNQSILNILKRDLDIQLYTKNLKYLYMEVGLFQLLFWFMHKDNLISPDIFLVKGECINNNNIIIRI